MKNKKIISLVFFILSAIRLSAASGGEDFMSNIGKIYVVIAVIVLIFIGIFAMLLHIERRVKILENQKINNE
ncbi:MAG TPA: hypothetical protein PKN57_06545 [Saprospiraceae bacterium]|nr:hypothetical protein [Saprospiraceae bacterium]MCC6689822.1 hypothetical protein [Saprospiraceae bacterium]HMV24719.1 hypothetical protein [Saprospiraceae bacterium]HMX83627.1 hypothetical protein [Saprospiraceae bacterium]HMX85067.1 hypothetical protein [Saprospiraceae bacterium]